MSVIQLVLVRHGESVWNKENRFTGWTDVDLSPQGKTEADSAGILLKQHNFNFDLAYSSVLKRSIHTLWRILDELDQSWIPVSKAWQLNERHYGALQGLNKKETAQKYGDEQVKIWRRSFAVMPPALTKTDPRCVRNDRRYNELTDNQLPFTESLKNTIDRVIPYWEKIIKSEILSGKKVLIVAHGNSLRALIKYIDNLTEQQIIELNIPTGVPLIYQFNDDLCPIHHYYLGNEKDIAEKIAGVSAQGQLKQDT